MTWFCKKNGLALTSDIGTRSPMQKWMQKPEWFVLVVLLCLPGSLLFGQGFDRGNLIFYGMGMGGVGNNSGSIQKSVYDTNLPTYLAINSPYSDTFSRVLNYKFFSDIAEERSRLASRGGEFGFEYGLFRYFGIGLSGSNQVITSSQFRTVDARLVTLFSLLGTDASLQLARLNQGDLYQFSVQKRRDVFNALSADLNLFLHFLPNQTFDPYIKIGGGSGSERLYGGATNRVFGAMGLRYHFNHRFFFSTELEHSNVYIVNFEQSTSGHRNKGNYEETFVKMGFGISFALLNQNTPTNSEPPLKVIDTVREEKESKNLETPNDSKLERFVFFASEIFDLPSSRIHLEGRARLDAIARSLENEFKEYDILIITYTSPYKEDLPGNFENYDLGFERAQAISRVLREKGVSPKRIIDSTQGSALYTVESKEKVVIELRKKIK